MKSEHQVCNYCLSQVTKDDPVAVCQSCGVTMHIECARDNNWRCSNISCAGKMIMQPGKIQIFVSGSNAKDVELVARSLLEQTQSKPQENQNWGIWITGGFYLVALISIGTLLLVVTSLVPLIALPIIVIGALLLFSIVGAFQLRQDQSLNEKNFLSLMMAVFTKIKFFDIKKKDTPKRG